MGVLTGQARARGLLVLLTCRLSHILSIRLMKHEVLPEYRLRLVSAYHQALNPLEDSPLEDKALEKCPKTPKQRFRRTGPALPDVLLSEEARVGGHLGNKVAK